MARYYLDEVLKDPEGTPLNENLGARVHLALDAIEAATPGNFEAILKYATKHSTEMELMIVTGATRRNPELCNTRAFVNWARGNRNIPV